MNNEHTSQSTTPPPCQDSPTSVTAIRGETAMLVCRVTNIGDKSVGDKPQKEPLAINLVLSYTGIKPWSLQVIYKAPSSGPT